MIISQSLPYLTWQQLLTLLVTLFLENSFFIWLPGHSSLDSLSSMLAALSQPLLWLLLIFLISKGWHSWIVLSSVLSTPLPKWSHLAYEFTHHLSPKTPKFLSLPASALNFRLIFNCLLHISIWMFKGILNCYASKQTLFSSHRVVLSQSFFPSKWYLLFWLFMPKTLEWSLAHLFLSLPTSANALSSWFEICPELDYFVTTSTALAQV